MTFLALWVGVPVGLYFGGYYVVGPRIGSRVPASIKKEVDDRFTMLNTQVQRIVKPGARKAPPTPTVDVSVTPPTDPATTPSASEPDSGGPQVEVSVRSTAPTHRTRRTPTGEPLKPKRHRTKPKPKPKPEATDEGSYGGTQDQGTTTTTGGGDPPTGG